MHAHWNCKLTGKDLTPYMLLRLDFDKLVENKISSQFQSEHLSNRLTVVKLEYLLATFVPAQVVVDCWGVAAGFWLCLRWFLVVVPCALL